MTSSHGNCSGKPEQKGHPLNIQRLMGLEIATEIFGTKRRVADIIGVGERSLAHKLSGDRGTTDFEVMLLAKALEKISQQSADLAAKLRDHLKPADAAVQGQG